MSEQTRQNRERCPWTASIVDELRAIFGPVQVVYVHENGAEIGTPQAAGVVPVITPRPLRERERG